MSAEVVTALHAQAHSLDAEADSAEQLADTQGVKAGREPHLLRLVAKEFHELAERVQGRDPATVNAEQQALADAGGSAAGMSVQKTDGPGPVAQHDPASPGVP